MHHPHQTPQGLPPPQHFQHPRSSISHQHPPESPHQPTAVSQGAYASPHSSTHSLPQQHQSPYVGSVPGPSGQHLPDNNPYYGQAHPSPYSGSASGSYPPSEGQQDLMAAHTMSRQFPPIYHTPQSNSPASVQSPQHDQHARSMYAQPGYQGMYYPQQYQMPQQSPYGQHPGSQPQHGMASGSMLMSQPGQAQIAHQAPHPHSSAMSPQSKMAPAPLQRPQSMTGPPQQTPTVPQGAPNTMQHGPPGAAGVNSNAAPGPIPATTPLVVRSDSNGVQWIAFEYSRDRVKMEYTIRCDVESVNVDELSQEFKTENCVYPRACCAKDQYKGNRLHYETECNTVGWALAQLNPCLRGKRGLIQRAVDSWRNSNQDPRLRSRRVRRQAKITSRKAMQAQQNPMGAPAGPGATAAGVPTSAGGMAPPRQGSIASSYDTSHHHQAPNGQMSASPTDVRQAQNFYPTYPTAHAVGSASLPPGGMDQLGAPHVASAAPPSTSKHERNTSDSANLFGDLPEAKRRKFILVDDTQRGTRVRVRVMLDQVNMEEMPDSYRKGNSVFPRSYFPTELQEPKGNEFFDDADDDDFEIGRRDGEQGENAIRSERVKTMVPVPTMDGSEAKVPTPRMSKSRRGREVVLNDLGYRMSWSQSRTFAGRLLFLQRSLDAYRNKMRSTMMAAGQDVAVVAPHFETRVGKRKWLERSKKSKREGSP